MDRLPPEDNVARSRQQWVRTYMGDSIPRLWCPPITHYTIDGTIDVERMGAHWRHMRSCVGGFLVPGSTGDGWEMSPSEIETLLDAALDLAPATDTHLLIGALYPSAEKTMEAIRRVVEGLKVRWCCQDTASTLQKARIAGFTICPPAGKALTQTQIQSALEKVLTLDVPISLYQLPQVTGNEMSPELVANLALCFPNLIFFKDTSGTDKVALSNLVEGVYMTRGAEGTYAQWLREAGGPYDGFLLSTANCFATHYGAIILALESGDRQSATMISKQVDDVVQAVFTLVSSLPYGNAFSNANKAMDHWMAFGQEAIRVPPPLVHRGDPLPRELIMEVGHIMGNAALIPEVGYVYKNGSTNLEEINENNVV